MSPFATAARIYARRGLHVFPLASRGKEPVTRHGFLDATTDEEQIARWTRRYPRANIGIALALSGLIAIDEDRRNGGDVTFDILQEQLGPLPETWTVIAGDGSHRYFRAPAEIAFAGSAGDGVDVKHDGYVVAPPSIHPSGRIYTWEASSRFDEMTPAELPAAWVQALKLAPKGVALPSSGIDARDSYLGVAFDTMGWLGPALDDGRRMVRCPWLDEHTDRRGAGEDTSTVLFPRALDRTLGGFRCLHGHCSRRTWRDVVNALPLYARGSAARAMRSERTNG